MARVVSSKMKVYIYYHLLLFLDILPISRFWLALMENWEKLELLLITSSSSSYSTLLNFCPFTLASLCCDSLLLLLYSLMLEGWFSWLASSLLLTYFLDLANSFFEEEAFWLLLGGLEALKLEWKCRLEVFC